MAEASASSLNTVPKVSSSSAGPQNNNNQITTQVSVEPTREEDGAKSQGNKLNSPRRDTREVEDSGYKSSTNGGLAPQAILKDIDKDLFFSLESTETDILL